MRDLKLLHFGPESDVSELEGKDCFILKTCQRSIIVSMKNIPTPSQSHNLMGMDAYHFLLEVICGLRSKLLGESEIMFQFREAFQSYLELPTRDSRLIHILSKCIQDAKLVRTRYLLGIQSKTYATLAIELFTHKNIDHVVILGSGKLAKNLIRAFQKKYLLSVCARNELKTSELVKLFGIHAINWEARSSLINAQFVINTIGCESVIFDEAFFEGWASYPGQERLFVDLGSPSTIDTILGRQDGVIRLNDLISHDSPLEIKKQNQIFRAREHIPLLITNRAKSFEKKFLAFS